MKYLCEPLIPLPLHLLLCTTEEMYERELRRLKIKGADEFLSFGSRAHCSYFENEKTGHWIVFVCTDTEYLKGLDSIEVACILVHEAVHVWQKCVEYIGERNPGREFEAYSIQAIAEMLMREWVRQTS